MVKEKKDYDLREKFKMYLIEKKINLQNFADNLGKNKNYICRVMTGHTFPGLKLIESIEKITEGAVKKLDFIKMRMKLHGIDSDSVIDRRKHNGKKTQQKKEQK